MVFYSRPSTLYLLTNLPREEAQSIAEKSGATSFYTPDDVDKFVAQFVSEEREKLNHFILLTQTLHHFNTLALLHPSSKPFSTNSSTTSRNRRSVPTWCSGPVRRPSKTETGLVRE
jgi:hypothetical protein